MYINDFKILEKVYEDIIGELYFANSPSLRKDVHFKFLHEYFIDKADIVETFHTCSKRARILEDEIFINVLSDGEQADKHFIIMEADDLLPLEAVLAKRGLFPPIESVSFIDKLANLVRKAHIDGLVHGGLTPQNIFVDENLTKVKIAGFEFHQLVRLLISQKHPSLLKVLPYFSPEMITGKAPLDRKSDIYSLGVLFYQILVGEAPWGRQNFDDIKKLHASSALVPPSLQRLEIPDYLDQLILEALEVNRDRRCQNVSEFLNKLNEAKTALLATRTPTSAILYEQQFVQNHLIKHSSVAEDANASNQEQEDEMFRDLSEAAQFSDQTSKKTKAENTAASETSTPAEADLDSEEDESSKEIEVRNFPFLESDELEHISPEPETESNGFSELQESQTETEPFDIELSHNEDGDRDFLDDTSEIFPASNLQETEENTDEESTEKTVELQIPQEEDDEQLFQKDDEVEEHHISDKKAVDSESMAETDIKNEDIETRLRANFDTLETEAKNNRSPVDNFNIQKNDGLNSSPDPYPVRTNNTSPKSVSNTKSGSGKKRYPDPDYMIKKKIAIDEDDDVMNETGTQTQSFPTTRTVNLKRVKPKAEDVLEKVRLVLIAMIPIMSIYLVVGIALDSKSANRVSSFFQDTFFRESKTPPPVVQKSPNSTVQADFQEPTGSQTETQIAKKQDDDSQEQKNGLENQINSILNQSPSQKPPPTENKIPAQTSTLLPTEVRLEIKVSSGQTPLTADVFLDGASQGTTDMQGRISIPNLQNRRPYIIKVQKQGFEMWAQEVRFIQPGLETITVNLQRLSANSASSQNSLSEDSVNASNSGSNSARKQAEATNGTKPKANRRTTTVSPGSGTINVVLSNPESLRDVYIYINGKLWEGKDNLAPAEIKLPGGSYRVEVKKAGYRSAPPFYSIDLLNGDQKTLTFILLPE